MQKLLIWIFILFVVMTSCRTLPKITPFVDASSEMHKGVKAGFLAIDNSLEINELSSVFSTDTASQNNLGRTLKLLESSRVKLKTNAKNLDITLSNITAYAAALNTLTESGNSGEKNALEALKSLTTILNQIAPPAAGIVGITETGVTKIVGEIAKARAIKKLTRIMDEASLIISKYNEILPKKMDEILTINKAIFSEKTDKILLSNSLNRNIMDYQKSLENNVQHINNHKELYLIVSYENSTEKIKKNGFFARIKEIDSLITVEKIGEKHLTLIEHIKLVDTEKKRISLFVEKIVTTQQRYSNENKLIQLLFENSKEAINAWFVAHEEIKEKLGEKTAPNFVKLLEIVDDMKIIKEKLKSLNP